MVKIETIREIPKLKIVNNIYAGIIKNIIGDIYPILIITNKIKIKKRSRLSIKTARTEENGITKYATLTFLRSPSFIINEFDAAKID